MIITISGPPRVGKSTMINLLRMDINKRIISNNVRVFDLEDAFFKFGDFSLYESILDIILKRENVHVIGMADYSIDRFEKRYVKNDFYHFLLSPPVEEYEYIFLNKKNLEGDVEDDRYHSWAEAKLTYSILINYWHQSDCNKFFILGSQVAGLKFLKDFIAVRGGLTNAIY